MSGAARGGVHDGSPDLRLTIDDDIFWRQRRGGISRYFVALLREFRADTGLGIVVDQPRLWTRNEHLIESGMGRKLPTRIGRKPGAQLTANRVRNIFQRPPDILHHTFYSRSYLDERPRPRVRAVTIYDMIPEVLPDLFPVGNPHLDKRELVCAADVILCISENTRTDLERFYGTQLAPIVVTPLAVGSEFSPSAPRLAHLPNRYVLYVGGREPYKDFPTLVEAFGGIADSFPDLFLVVVGAQEFGPQETGQFHALGITDRIRHVSLHDAEMAGAYRHAVCYVSTSRYEGFGLPTLEAMACGTPTVLADSSSHPEVGGDAALYFPPGDSSVLAAQLSRILSDDALRRDLSKMGLAQAARFTWRRTAVATADAYRMAVARR